MLPRRVRREDAPFPVCHPGWCAFATHPTFPSTPFFLSAGGWIKLQDMPNYRRFTVPGSTLFFTVVTYQRRPFLTEPLARRCLREAFQRVRARRPFEIPAIVLLPDHLHALWILPPGDADYSVRWRRIKEEFTERYQRQGGTESPLSDSRQRRKERGIWQRRFWGHTIQDDEDFERHVDYIHYNPVKHGLAACPRDCYIHRFIGG